MKKREKSCSWRWYVDPDLLQLTPLKVVNSHDFHVDRETFTKPNGEPHPVLVRCDKRGRFYLPTPPIGFELPDREILEEYIYRYRLTVFINTEHALEIARSVDPCRRSWSVHVSKRENGYKVTIFAESTSTAHFLLNLLKEGTFRSFVKERSRDHRDYVKRKATTAKPIRVRGRGRYRRPNAAEHKRLIAESLYTS
jgi:hypothetical protein